MKKHTLARKIAAGRHGIETDAIGFPSPDSLRAWHEKNNPEYLATSEAIETVKERRRFSVPILAAPVLLVIVVVVLALR